MSYETALAVSLAFALALLVTAVSVRHNPPLLRTAVAMLANLALVWLWALVSGIDDAWWFFLAIDGLTARVVLRQPAARAQAAIGFLYVLQCILHVRYAIGVQDDATASVYLDTLTAIGWGQLVALIMGATHGHFYRNRFTSRYRRAFVEGHSARMGQSE